MKTIRPISLLIFLFLSITTFCCGKKDKEQAKETNINTIAMEQSCILNSINVQDFTGTPVSSLLSSLPKEPDSHFFFDLKPGLLGGAVFEFGESCLLRVEVSDYKHLNQFDANRNWDIEDFKKEIIASATVEK